MSHSTHSARLHALAAALCALLLLVALGIMDAEGAPWWALLATQGALLVTTASAGIWLDRGTGGERRRGGEASWGGADVSGRWGQHRSWTGTFGYTLPGMDERVPRAGPGVGHAQSEEQVFWQERAHATAAEEDR